MAEAAPEVAEARRREAAEAAAAERRSRRRRRRRGGRTTPRRRRDRGGQPQAVVPAQLPGAPRTLHALRPACARPRRHLRLRDLRRTARRTQELRRLRHRRPRRGHRAGRRAVPRPDHRGRAARRLHRSRLLPHPAARRRPGLLPAPAGRADPGRRSTSSTRRASGCSASPAPSRRTSTASASPRRRPSGLATAVGGGVLRDVLANEMPSLLRWDRDLYAVPAMVGAAMVVLCIRFDTLNAFTSGTRRRSPPSCCGCSRCGSTGGRPARGNRSLGGGRGGLRRHLTGHGSSRDTPTHRRLKKATA